jgi:hypothetical protein
VQVLCDAFVQKKDSIETEEESSETDLEKKDDEDTSMDLDGDERPIPYKSIPPVPPLPGKDKDGLAK